MEKIEKLTPEQEIKMVEFREEWRKHGLSTEVVDVETTKQNISEMYNLIGKKPPVFIFCPSLEFAQFQIAYCRKILPLIFNDKANLGANLRDVKVEYEVTNFWGSMDAYWIAFYEFPEKFLGVNYTIENSKKLKIWSDLAKSCSWFWCYENYCFVADRPKEIRMSGENILHSIESPAISWYDGCKYFYIHGVKINDTLFKKISDKEYMFEEWIKEPNEEVKSAILSFFEEKFGPEYLFRFISDNLKEVNTYTNKKDAVFLEGTTKGMNIGVYTLFKGNAGSVELAFVRCYCPSTDRMFFLSVSPENNNAKDAIASLYRLPKKLINEIKYINRQGERFSTVLTEGAWINQQS